MLVLSKKIIKYFYFRRVAIMAVVTMIIGFLAIKLMVYGKLRVENAFF